MMPSPTELQELLAIAQPIAWQAARVLLHYYDPATDLKVAQKEAGDGAVTAADLAANDVILTALQQACGTQQFAYLSEETEDDTTRLTREWVWIIDPLDGTSDFIKRTGEFALHIGLAYRQRPVLGVVACPVVSKVFAATTGGGTFLEHVPGGDRAPVRASDTTDPASMVSITSRSHRNPQLEHVIARLPQRQELSVGSIGGKLGAIAEGRADYYISISGKSAPKDWDYCAPEIVLTEAGGKLSRFDGSPLTYNNPDVVQWGNVIASNGRSHDLLCQLAQAAIASFAP